MQSKKLIFNHSVLIFAALSLLVVGCKKTSIRAKGSSSAVTTTTIEFLGANPYNFGTDSTNDTHTFTLKNTGTVTSSVITASITGVDTGTTNSDPFGITTDNCTGNTLAPDATCTIIVTFRANFQLAATYGDATTATNNAVLNATSANAEDASTHMVGTVACPSASSNSYSTATAGTTFTVPGGCTSIDVKVWGGGGSGSGFSGYTGGGGGFVGATVDVTPGEDLTVMVGGGGVYSTGTGGANGGASPGGNNNGGAGAGGGFSALRRSGTDILLAGGGGGAGCGHGPGVTDVSGGAGGATSGGGTAGSGGAAATVLAGGTGGTGSTGSSNGSVGTAYQGGAGGNGSGVWPNEPGGGGGGGYYGGGGGGGGEWQTNSSGGGGGGSSFIATTGVSATSSFAGSGLNAGNNGDPDYAGSAGQGGADASIAGNPGLVVIKTP